MAAASSTAAFAFPDTIRENDAVVVSGGDICRTVIARPNGIVKLGRAGNVNTSSLIGMRYGDCFAVDERRRCLVPTASNPDLDRSKIVVEAALEEAKDNRNLVDTHGSNQGLSHEELCALRDQGGTMDAVVTALVEKSATYADKTAFSQEKYIRKKKAKYVSLFKIERVTPDNLSELQIPTALIEMEPADEASKAVKLRVDTLGLMLHHGNVGGSARVLCHDRTNGILPAAILYRLGPDGRVFCVYDKSSQPNDHFAAQMHLPDIRGRWKGVPKSAQLLRDGPPPPPVEEQIAAAQAKAGEEARRPRPQAAEGRSHWMRAYDARQEFLASPLDALIVTGNYDEILAVTEELLPFLANSGNLVVYSEFVEPLKDVYCAIRNTAVCINITETWYRHQQVLPGRTHPQVNMSTGGGFLLTAIKVEPNEFPVELIGVSPFVPDEEAGNGRGRGGGGAGKKRWRD